MPDPVDQIEDGLAALDCVCDLLVQADAGGLGLEFVAPGRLSGLIELIAGQIRTGLASLDRPDRCDQSGAGA